VPKVAAVNEETEREEEVENPFKYPAAESATNKVLWAAALPLYACFVITVPDCRKPKWERWYVECDPRLYLLFLFIGANPFLTRQPFYTNLSLSETGGIAEALSLKKALGRHSLLQPRGYYFC
jgi:hypothetical protein